MPMLSTASRYLAPRRCMMRRCCAWTAWRWPVACVPPRRCRCSPAPAGWICAAAGASARRHRAAGRGTFRWRRRRAPSRDHAGAGKRRPLDQFAAALLALNWPQSARAAARRALARAPGNAEALYPSGCRGRRRQRRRRAGGAVRRDAGAAGLCRCRTELGLACCRRVRWATPPRRCTRRCGRTPSMAARRRRWPRLSCARRDRGGARRGCAVCWRATRAASPRGGTSPTRCCWIATPPGAGRAARQAPAGRDGAHWRAHRALALLLLDRTEDARAELDAIGEPHDAEILVLWRRIVWRSATATATRPRRWRRAWRRWPRMLRRRCWNTASLPSSSWPASTTPTTASPRRSRTGIAATRCSRRCSRSRAPPMPRSSTPASPRSTAPGCMTGRAPQSRPGAGVHRRHAALRHHARRADPRRASAGVRRRASGRRCSADAPPRAEAEMAATVRALAALDAATLSAEAAAFLAALHALAPDAQRIVDKMPENANHLGFIAHPAAGRAHHPLPARSARHRAVDLSAPLLRLIIRTRTTWAISAGPSRQHERLMAHWRAVLPIPLLDVALSDWVEDFRRHSTACWRSSICPYDSGLRELPPQDRRVRTASAAAGAPRVNARGIGRWRRYGRTGAAAGGT